MSGYKFPKFHSFPAPGHCARDAFGLSRFLAVLSGTGALVSHCSDGETDLHTTRGKTLVIDAQFLRCRHAWISRLSSVLVSSLTVARVVWLLAGMQREAEGGALGLVERELADEGTRGRVASISSHGWLGSPLTASPLVVSRSPPGARTRPTGPRRWSRGPDKRACPCLDRPASARRSGRRTRHHRRSRRHRGRRARGRKPGRSGRPPARRDRSDAGILKQSGSSAGPRSRRHVWGLSGRSASTCRSRHSRRRPWLDSLDR